jgi:hypothetical protein
MTSLSLMMLHEGDIDSLLKRYIVLLEKHTYALS